MNLIQRSLMCLVLAGAVAAGHADEGRKFHNYLVSLSEGERNQRLTELLVQVPDRCVVERNFFRGLDPAGAAIWSAGCANKKAYAIKILDDAKGSTRILDCKVMMERAKVDCFSKL
jgi:hypothetical protein